MIWTFVFLLDDWRENSHMRAEFHCDFCMDGLRLHTDSEGKG